MSILYQTAKVDKGKLLNQMEVNKIFKFNKN